MNAIDIIAKKRDGRQLSSEEILFFITDYVKGHIPDYQAAALLMAVFLRGLDDTETVHLTKAMAQSGEMINLDRLGIIADKHSTGGVADSTTLICVPLACACGLKVAKMSGRGLGHTGGTIDKLESIPGFCTSLDQSAFFSQVTRVGFSVISQTPTLCPADKMLYALRDVTATVESIPLIVSSIMSKKLATGAHIIVLDVKTGSGAFMTQSTQAQKLAQTMVDTGRRAGRKTAAIISDMSQPLGNAVGNALEIKEAIDILSGNSAGGDLLDVSLALATRMLRLADIAQTDKQAMAMLKKALDNGLGLKKLSECIKAQGGDIRVVDDTALLPSAQIIHQYKASANGFVTAVDCRLLGETARVLGAGRLSKADVIDPAVGLIIKKRIGQRVKAGETLIELHANDKSRLEEALHKLKNGIKISQTATPPILIHGIIE